MLNPRLMNMLAVFSGIVGGSLINMSLIMLSGIVIPPPIGADFSTAESITASMPLLKPIHFLFPFIAHALGTGVGAFITQRISASKTVNRPLLVGAFFFAGGIMAAWQIPAPFWFETSDLLLAYFPMAYLGWKWGIKDPQRSETK